MSFRQDELERLRGLAIAKWPSQVEREHPHVLAPALVLENLAAEVWASALAYFDRHDISWWVSNEERTERKQLAITHRLPTGHLNSSQIACVNHLEPARVNKEMALAIARNLEPRVAEVRDTGEGGYFAFEWIGEPKYLNEPGAHVRGANVTSLDALMRVTFDDGTLALLAIEWKYLESYDASSVATSSRGTDRIATYRALIEAADSPLAAGEAGRLFYEPTTN
jgi:Restriction Endonuclease associating with ARP